jgi:hypothetical protein
MNVDPDLTLMPKPSSVDDLAREAEAANAVDEKSAVGQFLTADGRADSVAEREGFRKVGPLDEGVGPESSSENIVLIAGGPRVRIRLPPAVSPLRTCPTRLQRC